MDKLLVAIKGNENNIDAALISSILGINRVKGIHPIKDGNSLTGGLESVAILCTIEGSSYPNEWITQGKVLKYYLYGIKVNGEKKFDCDYKDNKAVINSKGMYHIYTFVRAKKGDKFTFEGVFELFDIGEDADGAMYFILNREGEIPKVKNFNIPESDNFKEGKEKERIHKYKERNPKVIKEAKRDLKRRMEDYIVRFVDLTLKRSMGN